jgi:NAD+ kinase
MKPLRFALFGNVYQQHKSAAIQHLLDCLQRHNAQVLIDEEYYDFSRYTWEITIKSNGNAGETMDVEEISADEF